ncbi:OmpA family protein [Pukyongiella litopenaei]|uniref:OmpA family protein n=1 Tax=Pukyongiella litopenaei TaxID=2605946 RepID=A0A2S0MSN4_9RHOB|nr:OmpA family protein [Pukyongiella litopenaei]AVO38876.1 OmpA family protein [Pukyongiella litopenaei]
MIRALGLAALVAAAPVAAPAQGLTLPTGARQLSERISPLEGYALPTGPFADGAVPARVYEGRVVRRTWRLGGGPTPLQIMAPLRDQIVADGYDILFQCDGRACGGFDFRFGTEVVPAPDMHVDLRDYRFLSATRGETEALSLLVSGGENAAHVQVIQVVPVEAAPLAVASAGAVSPPHGAGGDLLSALVDDGHVVLADLDFATGAARLGDGPFASLATLAGFLRDNPEARIAVVGHTDTVGGLADNIALSRRRAGAVRDRLIGTHEIAAGRIEAEGAGYLAPVASNRTPEGREANRRVEAVLLNRQ